MRKRAGLLQMLRLARDDGKQVRVVATETRPYLQGARLTACSVSQLGLDVTLIADSMAAYCMFKGLVNKVFTAADRISLDGWVANKIRYVSAGDCCCIKINIAAVNQTFN